MAIYPFYISSKSSTRDSLIEGGCRSKEGYQTTTILQRSEGSKIELFSIHQSTQVVDGEIILTCTITDKQSGEVIARRQTIY